MKLICLTLLVAQLPTSGDRLPSGPGLAALYPADQGIEKDARVVQVEAFEQQKINQLISDWESVKSERDLSFSDERPQQSGGKKSLLMDRKSGPGGALYRRIKNAEGGFGFEQLFVRYYVKFAEDCGELHHFGTCLGGNNPATAWPSVKAGFPTDGAKSFWSGIEPFGKRWTWDYYTYWCEMGGSPPRGQTWGNSFIHDESLKVKKGKWICIEQMIKMNDIGDTNGEQALWIDGKLVSHLGKGFPKGRWIFDKFQPGRSGDGVRWNQKENTRDYFKVPEGGSPFEGFRWRTVPELNINFLWLYVYTEKPAGHRIKVWFDDVIVATEYIGPLVAKK